MFSLWNAISVFLSSLQVVFEDIVFWNFVVCTTSHFWLTLNASILRWTFIAMGNYPYHFIPICCCFFLVKMWNFWWKVQRSILFHVTSVEGLLNFSMQLGVLFLSRIFEVLVLVHDSQVSVCYQNSKHGHSIQSWHFPPVQSNICINREVTSCCMLTVL